MENKTKNFFIFITTFTILLLLIGFASAASCLAWHDSSKDSSKWGPSRCINLNMDTGTACTFGTFNCDGYGDCSDPTLPDGPAYCQSCGCTGAPVGYVDGLTNCAITGWARDNFYPPFKSTVHLYFDGQAGYGGVGINIGVADTPREPGVGMHGFNTVRSSIVGLGGAAGSTHTVYGYSWDVFGNRYDLTNFPKTITIPYESCNGADDDCNGVVDNGLTAPSQSCTVGVGACTRSGTQSKTCNGASGWSDWGSCSVSPGNPLTEGCNGADDNCDGIVDNIAFQRSCTVGTGSCQRTGSEYAETCIHAQIGYVPVWGSCSVSPGTPGTESCNGADDNCDGTIDNGLTAPSQSCTVGVGACTRSGTQSKTCNGASGWSDWGSCSVSAGIPSAETCNGIDDNCDGTADNGNLCSAGQICSSGSCITLTCSSNSDCGTSGWEGALTCSGNNVMQNYRIYTCSNPGTYFSLCSSSVSSQVNLTCSGATPFCSAGSCITTPDTTAPVFTNLANQTLSDNQSLSYDIDATDASGLSCFTVNDTSHFNINCAGLLTNATKLNMGLYWLNITVNDTLNNRNSGIIFVNVTNSTISQPTTLPIIAIISPISGTYNTTSILLNSTSTQIVTWTYSLNGSANTSFTPGTTTLSLGNGTYNLLIYGTNANGTGSDTVNFVINTSLVYTYSWQTDSWSSCDDDERTRDVWCERSDSVHVADGNCSGTKPDETDDCNSGGNSITNNTIKLGGSNLVIKNQTTTHGTISLLNSEKSLWHNYKTFLWIIVFLILLLLLIILLILIIRANR